MIDVVQKLERHMRREQDHVVFLPQFFDDGPDASGMATSFSGHTIEDPAHDRFPILARLLHGKSHRFRLGLADGIMH